MDSTINTLLVVIAAIVFNGGGFVQAWRVIKRQSARDVSMLFVYALALGTFATCWLAYRTDASAFIITERLIGSLCALCVTAIITAQRIADIRRDGGKDRYWNEQLLARSLKQTQTTCDCKRPDGTAYPDKDGCRCPEKGKP